MFKYTCLSVGLKYTFWQSWCLCASSVCVRLCVVIDSSSISQCTSSSCPEKMDGSGDHVPFTHTAPSLTCPLIPMQSDGESQINVFILGNIPRKSSYQTDDRPRAATLSKTEMD